MGEVSEVVVSAATGVLGPVLAWQGRRVWQAMPPMVPAEGDPFGVALPATTPAPPAATDGSACSAVLLVGESTVAGCGSPTHVEAFGGQLGAALAAQLGRAVSWHAVGRIGVTARRAIDELEPDVAAAAAITPVDVALIALGVNDTLRRRSTQAYITALADVVTMVRRHTGPVPVVLVGVPPVGSFPLLPQPLSTVLGLRARLLDRAAAGWAARRPGVVHVPAPIDRRTLAALTSADGFHPSPAGYARLAGVLAPVCANLLMKPDGRGAGSVGSERRARPP